MARQVILWIAVGAALAAVSRATQGLLAMASGALAVLALMLAGIFLIVGGLARRRLEGSGSRAPDEAGPDRKEEE